MPDPAIIELKHNWDLFSTHKINADELERRNRGLKFTNGNKKPLFKEVLCDKEESNTELTVKQAS